MFDNTYEEELSRHTFQVSSLGLKLVTLGFDQRRASHAGVDAEPRENRRQTEAPIRASPSSISNPTELRPPPLAGQTMSSQGRDDGSNLFTAVSEAYLTPYLRQQVQLLDQVLAQGLLNWS